MPDYMYQLESRLSAEQRAATGSHPGACVATESNLYLVGGAVRDLIPECPSAIWTSRWRGILQDRSRTGKGGAQG